MIWITPSFASDGRYKDWYFQHHYNQKKCDYLKPHLDSKPDRWQCSPYGPYYLVYPEYHDRDPYGFEPKEELDEFKNKKTEPY